MSTINTINVHIIIFNRYSNTTVAIMALLMAQGSHRTSLFELLIAGYTHSSYRNGYCASIHHQYRKWLRAFVPSSKILAFCGGCNHVYYFHIQEVYTVQNRNIKKSPEWYTTCMYRTVNGTYIIDGFRFCVPAPTSTPRAICWSISWVDENVYVSTIRCECLIVKEVYGRFACEHSFAWHSTAHTQTH